MDYNPSTFEEKWQKYWAENNTYKTIEDPNKPKYYVLDMFPYPSGAGLHVGHPLGYIATDIVSRYKRMTGHNVLHPMGFDAFGLPAEQYAIETGQHPRVTTAQNIKRYKEQLTRIGFDYDWSREVITSDPKYYKWTQWIFLKLFNSWYNPETDKAEPIETFILTPELSPKARGGKVWAEMTEAEQHQLLMTKRLAYQSYADVNWCPALGTVLANDEVKDGVSERGGHPVYRMKMRQWFLRITAYAERLLKGLDTIDWPDSLKEMQRNWIGRSEGARIQFKVQGSKVPPEVRASGSHTVSSSSPTEKEVVSRTHTIEVFTTRPDTIFGATFMVLAPEHELVEQLITVEQREKMNAYLDYVKKRSDRDRMAEKKVTGEFTGSYTINPMTNQPIPIYVAEYVLSGYGTGAIMAVPGDDERDRAFAQKFGLPIIGVIDRPEGATPEDKRGTMINSGFLNGMEVPQAIEVIIAKLEELGIGERKVQYKMRDAGFSRQRYWGEPFPIYYRGASPRPSPQEREELDQLPQLSPKEREELDQLSYAMDESELPLELPEVDDFKPTGDGKSPLANVKDWTYRASPPANEQVNQEPLAPLPGRGEDEHAIETSDKRVWAHHKQLGREFRKNLTNAERTLWQLIRNNQLDYKIRRQHAISTYIVDFVCIPLATVIEIDGGMHEQTAEKERDAERTKELQALGFEVIRFTNSEVLNNPEEVARRIKSHLDTKALSLAQRNISHSPTDENPNSSLTADPDSPLLGRGVHRPWEASALTGGEAQPLETDTMPGYAGSSWYFLRYMDPHNDNAFASTKAIDYWQNVDLYIGGAEHAVGHLLYSRFWHKFLKDLGYVNTEEPFKKMVNQGMIQGKSAIPEHTLLEVTSIAGAPTYSWTIGPKKVVEETQHLDAKRIPPIYVSMKTALAVQDGDSNAHGRWRRFLADLTDEIRKQGEIGSVESHTEHLYKKRIPVQYVDGDVVNVVELQAKESEFASARFMKEEDGLFYCHREVEKMSKSKHNVINPDDIIDKYGADALRMYEMFLGPIEVHKPWDTNGIDGVVKFLRKFWRLFWQKDGFKVSDEPAAEAELKILHKTIKKVTEDIERLSFNTAVSAFMICVNELGAGLTPNPSPKERGTAPLSRGEGPGVRPRTILEPLVRLLAPFAPHITEQLWHDLGHEGSVHHADFPKYDERYVKEDTFEYPVSINGKTRAKIELPLSLSKEEIEKQILQHDSVTKWLDSGPVKKVIVVPGRIINVVV